MNVLLDATSASFGIECTATEQKIASKLHKAGAVVCFGDPETLMHAKVVVGSTNWTGFAFTDNVEADVFVRSSELAQALQGSGRGCG